MNPRTNSYAVSHKEADQVRASRGFESFKVWGRENRKWASEHRRNGKTTLAEALDREYDKFVKGSL